MSTGHDKPTIDLILATKAVVERDISLGLVDPEKMRWTIAARVEEAKKLIAAGASKRKAAKILGVSHTQVQNDLATKLPKNGNSHMEISVSPTFYIEQAIRKGRGFAEAAVKLQDRDPGALRPHRFSKFIEQLNKQIQERSLLLGVITDYVKRSEEVDEEA